MKSTGKKVFNGFKRKRGATGGGPAPKPSSDNVMRTINLMKDSTSFKGIKGGINTFVVDEPASPTYKPSTNPLVMLSQLSDSDVESEVGDLGYDEPPPKRTHFVDSEVPAGSSTSDVTPNKLTVVEITPKRKHYEAAQDLKLKVLRKEENVQNLKIDNLKLQNEKLIGEIENARLQKCKLQLEIDILQQSLISKTNPAEIDIMMDILCETLLLGDDN